MIIQPWIRGSWADWRSRGGTRPFTFRGSLGAIDAMSQVPILGVIGANGGGKSMLCTLLSMRSLALGRRVVSTVRLLDWENPRPCPGGPACDDPENHETGKDRRVHAAVHPLYVKWTGWHQVRDLHTEALRTEEFFDVYADEVTGVAGSRDSTSLPKIAQRTLVQLRRGDCCFRWSAPAAGRADLLLREVSQGIATAVGYSSVVDPDSRRLWPQRRLFHWVLRDVRGVPDFTWSQLLDMETISNAWFWGPQSDAQNAYDTFAAVSMVSGPSSAGQCEDCGGTRRRHECDCSDYLHEKASHAEARAAGSPRSGVRRTQGDDAASSVGRRVAA